MVKRLPNETVFGDQKSADWTATRDGTATVSEASASLPLDVPEEAQRVAVVAGDCAVLAYVTVAGDVAVVALVHRLGDRAPVGELEGAAVSDGWSEVTMAMTKWRAIAVEGGGEPNMGRVVALVALFRADEADSVVPGYMAGGTMVVVLLDVSVPCGGVGAEGFDVGE